MANYFLSNLRNRLLPWAQRNCNKNTFNLCLQDLSSISVTPGTPAYNEKIKIYNPAFAWEHPSFIALPTSVQDCQSCLQSATRNKVPVAVRSGGHCFSGYSTMDGCGFVINLNKMKDIQWTDTTVKVQAGASWRDVYSQLDDSKHLVVGGCCPSVGIGGYVLGGGYGLLSRRFGLAADNALSMTMLTADGENIVTASPDENSDLFWGLCGGGGGNFGMLLDVTFKLHPAPPKFYWSSITYHNSEDGEKALKVIGENLDKIPDELNIDMLIYKLEGGHKTLVVDVVYSDIKIGDSPVLQELKKIVAHVDPPDEYSHYKVLSEEYAERHGYVHYEGHPVYMKGSFIDSIPPQLVDNLMQLELPDDPLGIVEFVHVGGQISTKSSSYSAYPHRSAQYNCYTYGRFDNEAQWETAYGFATKVHSMLASGGYAKGSYVNYMDLFLQDWQKEYYAGNYPKLCELKKKWNPIGNGGPMHFLQEIGSSYEPKP